MFGQRLKEERDRLDLSQPKFAELCGIKKNAQIKYEKEERQPDSDYLQKAYKAGVDVSYLLTGIRTQPVELPSDEAVLLDSYRALSTEQKRIALQFMLGGFERLKKDQNDDDDDDDDADDADDADNGNTGSNNKNSNNVNSNINSNNTNNNNTNSNNSNVLNSFNTESGFTELPFIYACAFCGSMAWLLGAFASWKAATDMAVSMSFGQVALLLWFMTIVFAIFGCNIGMKKYNEAQAKIAHLA